MTDLAKYMRQAEARRFQFGAWDCCLWVAGWIQAKRGIDVAAAWRGRYATEKAAAALIFRAGGLTQLLDDIALAHGLERTEDPQIGDVGVVWVETARGREHAAAIRTGIGWAVLSVGGLSVIQTDPLSAWKV